MQNANLRTKSNIIIKKYEYWSFLENFYWLYILHSIFYYLMTVSFSIALVFGKRILPSHFISDCLEVDWENSFECIALENICFVLGLCGIVVYWRCQGRMYWFFGPKLFGYAVFDFMKLVKNLVDNKIPQVWVLTSDVSSKENYHLLLKIIN